MTRTFCKYPPRMPSITSHGPLQEEQSLSSKSLLQAHCVHKSSQVESTALLGPRWPGCRGGGAELRGG